MGLLSIRGAAREFGISERRLRRAVDEGELAGYQLGKRWIRVDQDDVPEWVKTKKIVPAVERGRRRARKK